MRRFRKLLATALVSAMVLSTLVLVPSAGAAPTTWWVDIANGDNTNPGTEDEPLRTIDAGLAHAVAGDTVMVLPGEYGADAEQGFPVVLPPGVRLRSTDGADETTITGDGLSDVVRITDATSGTMVLGFSITDAGASGQQGIRITRSGGGPLTSWPLISECVIEGCGNLVSTGGGIFVEGASGSSAAPRIEYTTFRGNVADEGGGIYLGAYTDAMVMNCTFEDNTAFRGGGLCTRTEDGLYVSFCDFVGNEASVAGGLAVVDGGGEFTMFGGSVSENVASDDGGGMVISSYNPGIDSVVFSGNTGEYGGAMLTHASNVTLQNCRINGNFATSTGGAAYTTAGSMNVYNCTIVGNNSNGWNGVYAERGFGGFAEVYNSILTGHSTEDVHGANAISYCNTEDTDLAGDSNVGVANVLHVNSQFVGGTTYRLGPDSPCIDAADPGLAIAEDFFGYLRPEDGDGNWSAVNDIGYHEYYIPTMDRLYGADRYQTAARLATSTWTATKNVVLVSGENYPDALTAAGLAGGDPCPILLTRPESVPASTTEALDELNAETVIIVGGPAAVSQDVEDELAATYAVERIAGADRYETAAEVARHIAESEGASFSKQALIARGDAFPDALALSPLSSRGSYADDGLPILLTRPGELSPATAAFLEEAGIDEAYVAGGESAVSAGVKTDIDDVLVSNGGPPATRWAGADRYETAVAVAQGGADHGWARWDRVHIATGTNFPDALAGGARAGFNFGVILLTKPDALSPATADALADNLPGIYGLEVFGGNAALSATVYAEIEDALGL